MLLKRVLTVYDYEKEYRVLVARHPDHPMDATEYAIAVQDMLMALGDPATKVIEQEPAEIDPASHERQPSYTFTADKIAEGIHPEDGTDVTNFFVSGGIDIWFTGVSVTHQDGRQLQRIGLVPDMEVKPTIKGIQNGKDEVLETAVEYLQREIEETEQQN